MRLYPSWSKIQELVSVERLQRRLLKAEALSESAKKNRWVLWLPAVLTCAGVAFGYTASILLVVSVHPEDLNEFSKMLQLSIVSAIAGGGVGGFIGGFAGRQVVIRKFRRYWSSMATKGPAGPPPFPPRTNQIGSESERRFSPSREGG